MAYQTGTATSCTNMLDTIRGFVAGLGWTINYWGNDPQGTAGDDVWLSVMTPGGNYFNLLADNSGTSIYTRGATGYTSSASTRDSQPGQSIYWAQTNGLTGPFAAYYLFGSATYCHVVIEVVTNRFAHFGVGVLEKAGVYTGGEYHTQTLWLYGDTNYQHYTHPYNTWVFSGASHSIDYQRWCLRADVDGAVNNWMRFWATEPTNNPNGFIGGGITGRLQSRSPNYITGQSILTPSIIVGPRPAGGTCVYGSVKDTRGVNITNLTPKQILTIGSDEWMIFPVLRKGSGTQYEAYSGNTGIAYKKVT